MPVAVLPVFRREGHSYREADVIVRMRWQNYAEMVEDSDEFDVQSESSDERPVRKRTRGAGGSTSSAGASARPRLERNAKKTATTSLMRAGLSDSEDELEMQRNGASGSDASESGDGDEEFRVDDNGSSSDDEVDAGEFDDDDGNASDDGRRRSRRRAAKSKANAKRALIVQSDDSDYEDMPRKKQSTPRKQSSRKYSTSNQKAIKSSPADEVFVEYRIQTILASQVRLSSSTIAWCGIVSSDKHDILLFTTDQDDT